LSNGILSQEEIDALLNVQSPNVDHEDDNSLSAMDKDILGEIGNISMGNASTTLSLLVNRKVKIDTPKIEITTIEKLKAEYPKPFVAIEVKYTSGLEGANILIIKQEDALRIVDLMMGGTGESTEGELGELHLSAVGEAMNQMMGSAATSMSEMLSKRIDISPPDVDLADLNSGQFDNNSVLQQEYFIKVSFNMEIEGITKSELMQLIPISFARKLIKSITHSEQSAQEDLPDYSYPESTPPVNEQSYSDQYESSPGREYRDPSKQQNRQVAVQPVQFAPLTPDLGSVEKSNIGLIMDVPLQVTVELGRTRKIIKEILELSHGSIIELDKLAGEPVDILVNGKLIAKGEVVVIDENFGVRVTDIISPIERVNNLQ
jgi:flagellar motor switch protein FliN/FliY